MLNCSFKICILPCIVPAMGLNEIHVSVFGQEGHQLVVGPKNEKKKVYFWLRTSGEVCSSSGELILQHKF